MLPWEQGLFGDHKKQTYEIPGWLTHVLILGQTMTTNSSWQKKGGFLSHGGTPIAGWLIKENPIRMDDLGVPPFMDIYGKPHMTDACLKLNSLLRKPWAHLVRWSIQMVIVHSKLWNYHTVTHKNNWFSITSFHSEVTTNEEWWYKMMYGDMICYLSYVNSLTWAKLKLFRLFGDDSSNPGFDHSSGITIASVMIKFISIYWTQNCYIDDIDAICICTHIYIYIYYSYIYIHIYLYILYIDNKTIYI